MELDPEETRVLASLVEKQLTVPAQYPLTLNALTLACNQASSREPVVSYDEATVEAAVTRVKTKGLARFVHPSHGRSALRFGHVLDEVLGLDVPELALLAVLMLRGPQTSGELKARTQRMADFSSSRAVEEELERLSRRETPLVVRLGRRPGQKEERYAHTLGATDEASTFPVPPRTRAPEPVDREPDAPGAVASSGRGTGPIDVAELRAEVDELRAEVAGLRRRVDDLLDQWGT